jgi:hypothetical protein
MRRLFTKPGEEWKYGCSIVMSAPHEPKAGRMMEEDEGKSVSRSENLTPRDEELVLVVLAPCDAWHCRTMRAGKGQAAVPVVVQ